MEKIKVDCPTCGEVIWVAGVVSRERCISEPKSEMLNHKFTEFTGMAPLPPIKPDIRCDDGTMPDLTNEEVMVWGS